MNKPIAEKVAALIKSMEFACTYLESTGADKLEYHEPEHCMWYDFKQALKEAPAILAELRGMEWQDISTAPKIREHDILVVDKSRLIFIAFWDFSYDDPEKGKGKGQPIYKATHSHFYNIQPTHWMPLPQPPHPRGNDE